MALFVAAAAASRARSGKSGSKHKDPYSSGYDSRSQMYVPQYGYGAAKPSKHGKPSKQWADERRKIMAELQASTKACTQEGWGGGYGADYWTSSGYGSSACSSASSTSSSAYKKKKKHKK